LAHVEAVVVALGALRRVQRLVVAQRPLALSTFPMGGFPLAQSPRSVAVLGKCKRAASAAPPVPLVVLPVSLACGRECLSAPRAGAYGHPTAQARGHHRCNQSCGPSADHFLSPESDFPPV